MAISPLVSNAFADAIREVNSRVALVREGILQLRQMVAEALQVPLEEVTLFGCEGDTTPEQVRDAAIKVVTRSSDFRFRFEMAEPAQRYVLFLRFTPQLGEDGPLFAIAGYVFDIPVRLSASRRNDDVRRLTQLIYDAILACPHPDVERVEYEIA